MIKVSVMYPNTPAVSVKVVVAPEMQQPDRECVLG